MTEPTVSCPKCETGSAYPGLRMAVFAFLATTTAALGLALWPGRFSWNTRTVIHLATFAVWSPTAIWLLRELRSGRHPGRIGEFSMLTVSVMMSEIIQIVLPHHTPEFRGFSLSLSAAMFAWCLVWTIDVGRERKARKRTTSEVAQLNSEIPNQGTETDT